MHRSRREALSGQGRHRCLARGGAREGGHIVGEGGRRPRKVRSLRLRARPDARADMRVARARPKEVAAKRASSPNPGALCAEVPRVARLVGGRRHPLFRARRRVSRTDPRASPAPVSHDGVRSHAEQPSQPIDAAGADPAPDDGPLDRRGAHAPTRPRRRTRRRSRSHGRSQSRSHARSLARRDEGHRAERGTRRRARRHSARLDRTRRSHDLPRPTRGPHLDARTTGSRRQRDVHRQHSAAEGAPQARELIASRLPRRVAARTAPSERCRAV